MSLLTRTGKAVILYTINLISYCLSPVRDQTDLYATATNRAKWVNVWDCCGTSQHSSAKSIMDYPYIDEFMIYWDRHAKPDAQGEQNSYLK